MRACLESRFRNLFLDTGDPPFKLVRSIVRPGNQVDCTEFSPDGRLYLGGGDNGPLRIWEVGSGDLVRQLPLLNALFTPDGKLVFGHNSVGQDN